MTSFYWNGSWSPSVTRALGEWVDGHGPPRSGGGATHGREQRDSSGHRGWNDLVVSMAKRGPRGRAEPGEGDKFNKEFDGDPIAELAPNKPQSVTISTLRRGGGFPDGL